MKRPLSLILGAIVILAGCGQPVGRSTPAPTETLTASREFTNTVALEKRKRRGQVLSGTFPRIHFALDRCNAGATVMKGSRERRLIEFTGLETKLRTVVAGPVSGAPLELAVKLAELTEIQPLEMAA